MLHAGEQLGVHGDRCVGVEHQGVGGIVAAAEG